MPLVPGKQILDEAAKGGYGVGAYNVNNMEQVQAIMQAARETQSPVIMQASRNALKYASLIYLKHLMFAALEENPDLPLCVHLDHGPNLEICKQAIGLGFSSVMIDGSIDYDTTAEGGGHPPRSFEDNVRVTKEVVDYAHERGVSVEGELGTLGGIEDDTEATHVELTDPDEVEEFVAKTGVDSLVRRQDGGRFARAGHRDEPWGFQVQARTQAGDGAHFRVQEARAENGVRDARLIERSRGTGRRC